MKSLLLKVFFAVAFGVFLVVPNSFAGPMIEFGDDGGFLQMDIKLQVYAESTNIGSGKQGTSPTTDIHFQRMRLSFKGMLDDTWGAVFQTCGNPGTSKTPLGYIYSQATNSADDRDIRIIDAYIIGDFAPELNMKLGLTKIPLTRANLDDCFAPLTLDRSMFVYTPYGGSAAKFSRDQGIVFWGSLLDKKLKYWAGVFQGREGTNTWTFSSPTQIAGVPFLPGASFATSPQPKNSFEYVLRLAYDFLDPEPGSGYQGTYFGKKKIFSLGAGAAYQPNAVYRNVDFVNNKPVVLNGDTVNYKAYAADMMFEYPFDFGVVTLNGQYLKVDFDDAYKTDKDPADLNSLVAGLNGQKQGWFATVAYIPPFKVWKETIIQPYLHYEHWQFAKLLGINDQTIQQYGAGLNYYIKENRVRVTAEYLKTRFDKATGLMGVAAPNRVDSFDTYRLMFQLVL